MLEFYLGNGKRLEGSIAFQGLPIRIENPTESTRHWYDPHTQTAGQTKMRYPYGFIQGTLGTDGDEVDVFVGPDQNASFVFLITQMKAPDFQKPDEQKVMLGFGTEADAKRAYLKHYNDPRFFGSTTALTMPEFKEKLRTHQGVLIKHLCLSATSASIQANIPGGRPDMSKSTAVDILKGLTSRLLSTLKNNQRVVPTVTSGETTVDVGMLTGPFVAQAMHVDRPFEAPIAPKVMIATPMQSASPLSPDFMTSCDGCGYTHKSLKACPRCATNAQSERTATPIWRR